MPGENLKSDENFVTHEEFSGVIGLMLGGLLQAVENRRRADNIREDNDLEQARELLIDRTETIVKGARVGASPKILGSIMGNIAEDLYAAEGVLRNVEGIKDMESERLTGIITKTSSFIIHEKDLGKVLTPDARKKLNAGGRFSEHV